MNRRESLAAFAGAAASLAGCSGFVTGSGESSSTATAGEAPIADGPGDGSTGDPETLLVRTATDRPPLWLTDQDGEDGGRPSPVDRRSHHDSTVVDTVSIADRLAVAETVDRSRLDDFLDATDFETETVYLETIQIEACFELQLCRIAWGPSKVSTDYGRQTLPWDEPCGADEHVFETRLIRIPDAIAADDVNSFSSSVGGGPCGAGGARAVGSGGSSSGTTTAGGDQ